MKHIYGHLFALLLMVLGVSVCHASDTGYSFIPSSGRLEPSFYEMTLHASVAFVDSQYRLWLGYRTRGIDSFDPAGRLLCRYDSSTTAMTSDHILCFAEREGLVWAGTEGGVNSDDVLSILPDDKGIIHILSKTAFSLDPRSGHLSQSDPVHGLDWPDIRNALESSHELCQFVKSDAKFSHIPVVLLTARADQKSRRIGTSVKAGHYMSKPFTIEPLVKVLDNLLR